MRCSGNLGKAQSGHSDKKYAMGRAKKTTVTNGPGPFDPLKLNQFDALRLYGKSTRFINFAVMALALNQLSRIDY